MINISEKSREHTWFLNVDQILLLAILFYFSLVLFYSILFLFIFILFYLFYSYLYFILLLIFLGSGSSLVKHVL